MCSYAAMGSSLILPKKLLAGTQDNNEKFRLSKPRWIIYENGNYDLIADNIILKNCSPAINGQTVMPKNVFLGDSPRGRRIIYELSGGFLMLDLKTNKDSLSIGAEFSGFSRAPRWFYPISQAEIFGVKQFFRQGFGIGGPSGIISVNPLSETEAGSANQHKSWSYDSYMACAFLAEKETIAIGNIDHTDFLHRSAIYNRYHNRRLNHSESGDEHLFFESAMLLNRTRIENEYIKLPELHFFTGNKPYETIQELAWRINRKSEARTGSVTSYHWISKPATDKPFNFEQLKMHIESLQASATSVAFNTLVISNGYCVMGDWLDPTDNWPGGLDRAAREIFKNGYRAGIWIAPFIVDQKSELYKKHPDWIVRDFDGNPVTEPVKEEGTFYALDASHPDVLKHLSKVFHSLQKMGFIFFYTAYLESGLKDTYLLRRAVPGRSSVQIFRDALQVIRDEIGAGSHWMADQTPYAPVIGFADIVNVCRPCNSGWNDEVKNMLRETYFSQYFNNILWQNNPGEIDLSDESPFTENEKSSLALWKGFLGGAVGTTNNFTGWTDDNIRLFRFLEPDKQLQQAWFPFWPSTEEIKVAVRYYRQKRSWGVLFFNDKENPIEKSYRILDLTGEETGFVFSWISENVVGFGEMQQMPVNLQPHQSRLFWVNTKDEPPPRNFTLGGAESDELILKK